MGALAFFVFGLSQAYFGAISIDLYLSIRNPFGKPDAHLQKMHISIFTIISTITFALYISGNFDWREDMQICFIKAASVGDRSLNVIAMVTIYIPVLILILASVGIAVFAGRRLHLGLPDTFRLRMYVNQSIKQYIYYMLHFVEVS